MCALVSCTRTSDWHRFTGTASAPSSVRLTPPEYSSGKTRTVEPITKTGNGHVRRLLVEAAWPHLPLYAIGKPMQDRWALAPAAYTIGKTMRDRGRSPPPPRGPNDQGNRRLHQRWVGSTARHKRHPIATVGGGSRTGRLGHALTRD